MNVQYRMNAAVCSEFASVAAAASGHAELRVVWQSQFGDILIEVRDGAVFVNGDLVEPAPGRGENLPVSQPGA